MRVAYSLRRRPQGHPAAALLLAGRDVAVPLEVCARLGLDPAGRVHDVAGGFLLAGLQLFHSILDSLLVFGAIQSGAPITYGQWLGWFGYTLLFNVLGGLVLVTALRLLRTKELVQDRRDDAEDDPERAATEQD